MEPELANPFAVLSLIVAPAILTNASSVLIMSTSNRLARAVDRARALSAELEAAGERVVPESDARMRELASAERRALLLLRALRFYYTALSGFATAALLSLLGAVLVPLGLRMGLHALEVAAVAAGVLAVAALVGGSVTLVRETRIAVGTLQERASLIRARAAARAAGG